MRSGLDGSKTGPVRSGPDRSAVSGPRDRKKIAIFLAIKANVKCHLKIFAGLAGYF